MRNLALVAAGLLVTVLQAYAVEDGAARERGGYTGPYLVTDFTEPGFGVSGPATFDRGMLRILFNKGDSASLNHSLSLLGRPESLGLTNRGGSEGNTVSLAIGSHFQTFSRAIGLLKRANWLSIVT